MPAQLLTSSNCSSRLTATLKKPSSSSSESDSVLDSGRGLWHIVPTTGDTGLSLSGYFRAEWSPIGTLGIHEGSRDYADPNLYYSIIAAGPAAAESPNSALTSSWIE